MPAVNTRKTSQVGGVTEPIRNVTAYKFVMLDDLETLRDRLYAEAVRRNLRGTVLLASEGINLFLAGVGDDVQSWLDQLQADNRFADLGLKESWSVDVPFKRLKVKIKREIIRMDHPTIRPAIARAAVVKPAVLKRWLDQGRDDDGRAIVLLDARNDFEVDHGTFVGALDWRIAKFTEFPPAVARHRDALRDKRVITFCTGGIRCEKAAIFMAENGVDNVVQLDGGILRYFEEVGQDHFEGDCFVFDERVALDASLQPASS